MAEQSQQFMPQGEGPHPTLAGNMYDPKIGADGQTAGAGVGGTSAQRVQEEGAEHMGGGRTPMGSATTMSNAASGEPTAAETHSEGIAHIKSQMGGVDSTDASAPKTSMFDKLTSFIPGMHGHSAGATTHPTASNAGGVSDSAALSSGTDYPTGGSTDALSNAPTDLRSVTGSNVGSTEPIGGSTGALNNAPTDLRSTTGSNFGSTAAPSNAPTDLRSTTGSNVRSTEPIGGSTDAPSNAPTDLRSTTGSYVGSTKPIKNTEASAPSVVDTNVETSNVESNVDRDTMSPDEVSKKEEASEAPPKPADKKGGSGMVNESAIPMAGGQRLGQKHWGESKIVAEVPPRRESEAGHLEDKKTGRKGVSSEEGQSTLQTKANTAANTGEPPHHLKESHGADSGEKESAVDRIKDKLHMGHAGHAGHMGK